MFGALKPVSPPTSAEIEEVKRRLVSVELRLDRLEGKLPLSQAA
jgi:hypothetical protein